MRIVPLAAFAFFAAAALAEAGESARLKTFAVARFSGLDASSRADQGFADMVARRLEASIAESGRWKIVDRQGADRILSEQAFQQSGATRNGVQSGNMLGADHVVGGDFFLTRGFTPPSCRGNRCTDPVHTTSVRLSLKVIDVESGQIRSGRGSIQGSFTASDKASADAAAIDQVVAHAMAELREMYPAQSQGVDLEIVRRTGDEVWFRGGTNIGIQRRAVFKAVRPGEAILDPTTGEVLSRTDRTVGKLVVLEVQEKASRARILEGTADVRVGDALVELPKETASTVRWAFGAYATYSQREIRANKNPSIGFGLHDLDGLWGGGISLSGKPRRGGWGFYTGIDLHAAEGLTVFKWDIGPSYTWYLVPERLKASPTLVVGLEGFTQEKTRAVDSVIGDQYYWTGGFDSPSGLTVQAALGLSLGLDLSKHFGLGVASWARAATSPDFSAKRTDSDGETTDEVSVGDEALGYSRIPPGIHFEHQVYLEYAF